MVNVRQGFPNLSAPLVDLNSGRVTDAWQNFLQALWQRTGAALGDPSLILDTIGSTQGDILYRNATAWVVLAPSTAGFSLKTGGPGANPSWTVSGTGTVTNVATGTGLTGGAITTTGTISFASIANNKVLANVSGGAAAPVANDVTAVLDAIGAVQGNVLYRGAANWSALAPGSNGQVLKSAGAAANPAWDWPATVGTAITAAGATQATATALTKDWNEVTTVAAGTGVVMPALSAGQEECVVFNRGANALKVYPNGVAAIDALGASVAYSVPVGKSQTFRAVSAVQIYSDQPG